MPPRSYIEAMDRPTILYILYTMVSAQQTNFLPKNASRNDTIFGQKVYQIYTTTSQYLISHSCAITMVYIYVYIYIYINMLLCMHVVMKCRDEMVAANDEYAGSNSKQSGSVSVITGDVVTPSSL